MSRILQTNLAFKLEKTSETITSRSGLAAFFKTALALGVVDAIRTHMPRLGSNRAFRPEEYIMPLALMLIGGGHALEDIREIKQDTGLRKLCGLARIPGADAIGKWLRRVFNLKGLKRVSQHLVRQIINASQPDDFTLDTDATLIETEKNCAEFSYQGYKAFSALVSFIPELGGLCVASEYRNGNASPATGITGQLKAVHRLLKSSGKRLKYFRSDSAAYTAEVINLCSRLKVTFAIAGDQDSAVKAAITQIAEDKWNRLYDRDHVYTERQYARARHCMEKTAEGFDLIIIRWANPQADLFDGVPYGYHVIATNDYERGGEEIVRFYNERGNAENYLKELKNGFGMEYAPSRLLRANGVFFEIGVLAYNLAVAFKRVVLRSDWVSRTIATWRWQIVNIAGKVIEHGRQLVLRVMGCHYELLQRILAAIETCVLAT